MIDIPATLTDMAASPCLPARRASRRVRRNKLIRLAAKTYAYFSTETYSFREITNAHNNSVYGLYGLKIRVRMNADTGAGLGPARACYH
jgi:hypothetical protein